MRSKQNPDKGPDRPVSQARRPSKKDQILTLYAAGINEVEDLAMITKTRPTHVAAVLEGAKLLPGYFDLYTTTAKPMNIYSKFFAGKLGYRDPDTARRSVELIDNFYRQFELAGDRAGQHHALLMALTMFDRARWTGKAQEADVFRRWLTGRLAEADLSAASAASGQGQPAARGAAPSGT